jgi:hypothetical protein
MRSDVGRDLHRRVLGSMALMSFIEFAKLAPVWKPCNQPTYYFRDLFRDYQRPRLSLRTWHLHEPVHRLLSTSVLAVLGEGCQARPELNSSGLFFDLSFTQQRISALLPGQKRTRCRQRSRHKPSHSSRRARKTHTSRWRSFTKRQAVTGKGRRFFRSHGSTGSLTK